MCVFLAPIDQEQNHKHIWCSSHMSASLFLTHENNSLLSSKGWIQSRNSNVYCLILSQWMERVQIILFLSAGLIHRLHFLAKSSHVYLDFCMLIGGATRTVWSESITSTSFLLHLYTHLLLGTSHPAPGSRPDLTLSVYDLCGHVGPTLSRAHSWFNVALWLS